MPCMIWVACMVEIAIEDWTDFFILLSLQLINASVSLCAAGALPRAPLRPILRLSPASYPSFCLC